MGESKWRSSRTRKKTEAMNIYKQKAEKLDRRMRRILFIGTQLVVAAVIGSACFAIRGKIDAASYIMICVMLIDQVVTKIRNLYVDEYNELCELSDQWEHVDGRYGKKEETK